ncbi:fluoroquinolone export ABC transporter permease subunit [Micromonospora sp. NBC_01813]|uniref:fluoroquinolone export ABC transporter permease subunit n=1 Tax=Micromonospora sp. NBC_01813 TaxID=2975988 RepID=UPI002DD84776|nr:hypothetical protein [Micromonospora sp. NBC_01813]WSA12363.1 hypothetical protein OG958_17185 [Micromonospora sp. NBC_01813]
MSAARRIAAASMLEVRIEWRYRVVAVAGILAVGWSALLIVVPAPAARTLGPIVLLVDTAAFGAFFIALLLLNERGEGALAALRVTPLRTAEHLAVKLGVLTGLSVVAAVPVALAAGRPGRLLPTLLGVLLTALLILAASLLLVLPQRTVTGFLTTAPLVLLPGLAVPLAYLAGLLDHPVGYLVPTTGTAELIRVGITGSGGPAGGDGPAGGWWWGTLATGYALVWIAGLVLLAGRRFGQAFATPAAGSRRPARAFRWPTGWWPTGWWPTGWLAAMIRVDLRVLGADRLLILLIVAPLLLATALRYGHQPAVRFVDERYGVDLTGHTGLLLALLVLAHLPVIGGMLGSLLLLDDIDERRMLLLRVTPVTLERYLGYRVAVTGGLTLVGLLIAVPLSGLAAGPLGRLVPAALLAAGQAVVVLLVIAGFAGNKVHGLALLKLLGGALMALAALPWLPMPADWPAAAQWPVSLLPPVAVSLAQRAGEAGELRVAWGHAAIGAVATVAGVALLARRSIARFTS